MKIFSKTTKSSNRRLFWFVPILGLLFGIGDVSSALAQKGPIPKEHYYRGRSFLEQGDIVGALQHYQTDLNNATRIGTMRWIDSICYQAALGETLYISGRTEDALAAFNEAIALYFQYPKWLARVNYPTGITTVPRPAVPWGPGARTSPIGVFPMDATIVIGDEMTEDRIKQGGMLRRQEMIRIDPMEILRCMALAVRRRAEILGPLSRYDALSDEILNAFSTRQVSPNHWSVTWLDVLFGLALKGAGKNAEARDILNKSLVMAGQYDHSLTGVALLELGKLYLADEHIPEAVDCFYEASISAFHFNDLLLVEEALRYYSNARKAMNRLDNDPVVLKAFEWFKTQNHCQLIQMSLSEELAENFVIARQFAAATQGLKMIESLTRNSGLRKSRYADRWNYLNAMLFYSRGNLADGDAALAQVVEGMKFRSLWVFQIAYLDNLSKTGGLTTGSMTLRNAADVYEYLLREPTATDWAVQPMDCLAVQVIVPPGAFERWFLILRERDLRDKAFDVAERARRERFYATQPFGGRLLSLRYLLEAAENCLPNEFKINRQDVLIEFPEYHLLLREARNLKRQLHSLPIVPKTPDEKTLQNRLLVELEKVGARQESILRYIASSRIRIPITFPPVKSSKEMQNALPEETSLLAFFEAGGDMYAFLLTKEILDCWRVGSTDRLNAAVANFLKNSIECVDGTKPIPTKDVVDNSKWKESANALLVGILGNPKSGGERFSVVFKHLIIVPDKSLWYLPFEALCVPKVKGKSDESAANGADELGESKPETADKIAASSESELEKNDSATSDSQDSIVSDDATKATETKKNVSKKNSPNEKREWGSFLEAPDLTIRYAATAGLGIPGRLGRSSFVETTIVPGYLYPKEPEKTQQDALLRLSQAISQTVVFPTGTLDVPSSVLAPRLKQLIVFDEILGNNPDSYNWVPFLASSQKVANNVLQWIRLPWGAPRLIVLPGFRSGAENALKTNGDGGEFFFPILAMQASGAETILASRWRVGGRSTYDLVENFMKNSGETDYATAWKKAVQSLWETEIVLNEEPRLKGVLPKDKSSLATHPFFWSGFMLISPGENERSDESEDGDYLSEELTDEEISNLKEQKANAPNADSTDSSEAVPESNDENVPDVKFDSVDLTADSDAEKTDGSETVSEAGDSSEKTDGLEPTIRVPAENQPTDSDDGNENADETSDATSEKSVNSSARPSAPRPVTDEDIEDDDENADDFFSRNAPKNSDAKKPVPQEKKP